MTVEINGSAFGGSPFPVFFSPPDENAIAEFKAQAAALVDAAGNRVDSATSDAAKDLPMPTISQLVRNSSKTTYFCKGLVPCLKIYHVSFNKHESFPIRF